MRAGIDFPARFFAFGNHEGYVTCLYRFPSHKGFSVTA